MANPPAQAEKKHRSLTEFIIVIIIMAIMIEVLITQFFSQQDKITETAFIALAQSFTSKVNVIHSQWLMDEQPDTVIVHNLDDAEKQYVSVNQFGWIDSKYASLPCQHIWQQALLMPLTVVKSPVTAVEIKSKVMKNARLCRYTLANGQSFDYRSDTGKVQQVN